MDCEAGTCTSMHSDWFNIFAAPKVLIMQHEAELCVRPPQSVGLQCQMEKTPRDPAVIL